MRILHVISALQLPHPFGGHQTAVAYLSRALALRGHQVEVLTSDFTRGDADCTGGHECVDGVTIHRVPHVSTLLARRTGIVFTPSVSAYAKDIAERFDVIHLHDVWAYQNWPVCAAAIRAGTPYLLQAHGALPRNGRLLPLKVLYDVVWGRRVLHDAALYLAMTAAERGQYVSLGCAPSRIVMVGNGIEVDEFRHPPTRGAFRDSIGITPNDTLELFLGRLHPIKGVDVLVRAHAAVRKKVPNAHLAIVGPDDGFHADLSRLVAELGLEDCVHFVGALSGSDKTQAYVDADVFVLPSRYETYPTTVLEALACRTPVVITDVCGIASAIKKLTGALVVPVDEKALANAVVEALEIRDSMAPEREKARDHVIHEYDWDNVSGNYEQVYAACVNDRAEDTDGRS